MSGGSEGMGCETAAVEDVVAVARQLGYGLAEWTQPEGSRTTNRGRIWLATTHDGEPVVVKWSTDPGWAQHIPHSVRASKELLARGYPCPRTLAHGPVAQFGYGIVQQCLPGTPCTDLLSLSVLDQVLAAVELQANPSPDANTSHLGWSWVPAVVFDDEAKWWAQAWAIDAETAELCDELESWLMEVERPDLRSDYVHLDLNFSNILAADDALTGIVDLDHLAVGDRTVDIAGLAFQYCSRSFETGVAAPMDVVERIKDAALAVSGESGWRQAVAYRSISALGWSSPDGFRVPIDQARHAVRCILKA